MSIEDMGTLSLVISNVMEATFSMQLLGVAHMDHSKIAP